MKANRVIITGGAGFIGSAVCAMLNGQGYSDIIIVDHLDDTKKWRNLVNKEFLSYHDKYEFLDLISDGRFLEEGDVVIHMGACSSTTETDSGYLMKNNTQYTFMLYRACVKARARLIYASSAATYGNGDDGYDDSFTNLKPMNMYGYSKHLLDKWVLTDTHGFSASQMQCVGLKFFNAFGPNEYHKATMASMVFHGFNQIKEKGYISLFKSHRPGFEDGGQLRDFIYVKDVTDTVRHFLENDTLSGIFNIGTGEARSFLDLAKATFSALKKEADIRYIDMPDHLRNSYQYYTQADITKLRDSGYSGGFSSLEDAVEDYVVNYLDKDYLVY